MSKLISAFKAVRRRARKLRRIKSPDRSGRVRQLQHLLSLALLLECLLAAHYRARFSGSLTRRSPSSTRAGTPVGRDDTDHAIQRLSNISRLTDTLLELDGMPLVDRTRISHLSVTWSADAGEVSDGRIRRVLSVLYGELAELSRLAAEREAAERFVAAAVGERGAEARTG
jgi:hypothetical protein